LKLRTLLSLLIITAGVLAILYAAFLLVQDGPGGSVSKIVGNDAVIGLAGGVVLLVGIVVQGMKRLLALIIHLVSVIFYYEAILKIQNLGQQGISDYSIYLTQTQFYWAVAIILGIVGIVVNGIGKKPKESVTPAGEGEPAAPAPK
jgi:hypothetical protein